MGQAHRSKPRGCVGRRISPGSTPLGLKRVRAPDLIEPAIGPHRADVRFHGVDVRSEEVGMRRANVRKQEQSTVHAWLLPVLIVSPSSELVPIGDPAAAMMTTTNSGAGGLTRLTATRQRDETVCKRDRTSPPIPRV